MIYPNFKDKWLALVAIATIVTITTSAQPGSNESRNAGNVPIEFYGKVIDQEGAPIEHAEVTLEETVGHLSSPTTGYETYDTVVKQTDENGDFVLNHTEGMLLKVVSIGKPGYELSKKAERYFAYNIGTSIFHPDHNNPVVFKMWKRAGKGALVTFSWHGKVACDGTTNRFSLTTGHLNDNGELEIRCMRTPVQLPHPSNIRFDYDLQVTIGGGGIQPTDDEFTYKAPSEGYLPTVTIGQRAIDPQWNGKAKQDFYFKTAEGHYGRLTVDWYDWQFSPTVLKWDCSINPSGSCNLER